MSETPRKKITERQAEARRANGKKARGPITEEGKQRSSANSLKHGVYALRFQAIERGALAEDPDEFSAFISAVVAELDPGDNLFLRQLAANVAVAMMRDNRAVRWEALGYSRLDLESQDAWQSDWRRRLAARDRRAAETIRSLPESSVTVRDLWDALTALGSHREVRDETSEKLPQDASPEVLRAALAGLIDRHFPEAEAAAQILELSADRFEEEAAGYRSAARPEVAHREVSADFTRNAIRLKSHTSRELDQAVKRYWDAWDRMRFDDQDVGDETNLPADEQVADDETNLPADEQVADDETNLPHGRELPGDEGNPKGFLELMMELLAESAAPPRGRVSHPGPDSEV